FFSSSSHTPLEPPSFPTRRSSDLRNEHGRCSRSASGHFSPLRNDSVMSWPLSRFRSFVLAIMLAPRAVGELNDTSTTIIGASLRSEEHTSELQSRENLVCRLLLEK